MLVILIRITSTAPVEVVPENPKLVTAPFDGVVKDITVSNNQNIKENDLIVLLEDNDLLNNLNLAKQSLKVAEKDLFRSRQFSFSNNDEKSKLAELSAQVDLKKAELISTEDKLKKSKIYSNQSGVAIIDQKDDWQGKPVAVGEKILTIADPKKVEFLIRLPVKDLSLIHI